jgi:glycosyltransferase involved in cell wall biosynthesis
MKKILLITTFFYPDYASTGQIMTELCENLQDIFDITVVTAFPSYSHNIPEIYKTKRFVKETYKNINIIRVKVPELSKEHKISRIKHMLQYFVNALFVTYKYRKEKIDIVFTMSQPPILGGVIGVISKFLMKNELVYNIQDFHPEAIEVTGYSKNKWLLRFIRKIDNISCNYADKVVVVGRDMRETLLKRDKKFIPNKCEVINNWINEQEIYPLPKEDKSINKFLAANRLLNKFIIMYSGNIGLYYDLENIIKIADRFKDNCNMHFVFIGEGVVKKQLIDYCKDHSLDNVSFLPYQPKDKLIYSLNAADVHLVTNQKGIKGISVPSKIYGVMAVGKPVIGVLEKGSEARLLIEDSGCGICVEPQDYDGIVNAINELYGKREQLPEIGMRGREYLEKHCSMESSINKYKQLLLNI